MRFCGFRVFILYPLKKKYLNKKQAHHHATSGYYYNNPNIISTIFFLIFFLFFIEISGNAGTIVLQCDAETEKPVCNISADGDIQ